MENFHEEECTHTQPWILTFTYNWAGFTTVLYFTFTWVFPELRLFLSPVSLTSNEKIIYFPLVIRRIFNEKKYYLINFLEPEFLKHKTKFILLTTKCNMTKYDQIMNKTLLHYQQVEKCKNFPWAFLECFDFPRNFSESSSFSLIF